MKQQTYDTYVQYANGWEKQYIQKYFSNFDKRDSRLYPFLRGLDEDSCQIAIRIINQLDHLKASNYEDLPLFTKEESRNFNRDSDMQDEILQLGDNLFCHRGYFLTVQHFTNDVFKYKYSLHRLCNQACAKDRTVVDIGGCSGDSAILFNRELKPKTLFVFEPNPFWASQIEAALKLNDVDNGFVIQGAVGSHEDQLPMTMTSLSGMSGFTDISQFSQVPGGSSTQVVRVAPFDKYVSEMNIDNIGLIKVDIEGFEKHFLEGARSTIEAHRPVLIICIYHSWDDFVDIKTIIESWNLGYTFKIDKAMNGCVVLETVLIAEPANP